MSKSHRDKLRTPSRDIKSVSARRAATADVLGSGAEYSRAPHQVRPNQVVANPRNPRVELDDEGLQELVDSMREMGQVQPATVMTRGAYLSAIPEDEPKIGTAEYVVISGSRRLMAAQKAELETFLIYVHDTLDSRESVLAFALVENIQRRDLSPLDEAQAVRDLVDTYGNQTKVADLLGKARSWVTHRLNLLNLAPDLKHKLITGELPIRDARSLGGKPTEEQEQEWERRKAEKAKPANPPSPEPQPIADPGGRGPEPEDAPAPLPAGPPPSPPPKEDPARKAAGQPMERGEQLMLDLQWEPRTMAERLRAELGPARFALLVEAGLELTG